MQDNSLTGVKVRMRWNSAAGYKKIEILILCYKNKGQSADWDPFLLLGVQEHVQTPARYNTEMGAGRITAS